MIVRDLGKAILGRGRRNPSDLLLVRRRDPAPPRPVLRVVSYNVLAGWLTSIERIAEELVALDPDVVALQEIDHRMSRTGRVDQTALLAEALNASSVFAGSSRRDGGDHGIALLSRLPILTVERLGVPTPLNSEPRVALEATIDLGNETLRMIAVHADNLPWSAALNSWWLSRRVRGWSGPSLVAGDLNAPPWAPGPKRFAAAGLTDLIGRYDPGPTFISDVFTGQLDYVLVDDSLLRRARTARRVPSRASDHLPVVAELNRAT